MVHWLYYALYFQSPSPHSCPYPSNQAGNLSPTPRPPCPQTLLSHDYFSTLSIDMARLMLVLKLNHRDLTWYADIGASTHIANYPSTMYINSDLKTLNLSIIVGNGSTIL